MFYNRFQIDQETTGGNSWTVETGAERKTLCACIWPSTPVIVPTKAGIQLISSWAEINSILMSMILIHSDKNLTFIPDL